MLAAQYGSNAIIKGLYSANTDKLKIDILDNLGRGIFTLSKDLYTKFLIISIANNKASNLNNIDSKTFWYLKDTNDNIKDIWNHHLK